MKNLPIITFKIGAFLLFNSILYSQTALNISHTEIDYLANSKNFNSPNDLVEFLNKNTSNDFEKVQNYYVWITHHIAYDTKSYFSGSEKIYTSAEVLKRRKAVCQGYSTLFKTLCDLSNIPCEIISGYSKGFGYNPKKLEQKKDHAWNAVQINDNWYLIDATWGAGHLNMNNKFEASFKSYYFFSPPETFIYKHLPADPMWQLLQSPINVDDFKKDSIELKKMLLTSEKYFNFNDSINYYLSLDSEKKNLKMALNEYRFNNKLSAPVGYAYMNIAYDRFESLINNPKIDPVLAFNKQKEVLSIYEKALYYFNINNDITSVNARKTCRDNIKSCKKNLDVYDKMIQMNKN